MELSKNFKKENNGTIHVRALKRACLVPGKDSIHTSQLFLPS